MALSKLAGSLNVRLLLTNLLTAGGGLSWPVSAYAVFPQWSIFKAEIDNWTMNIFAVLHFRNIAEILLIKSKKKHI